MKTEAAKCAAEIKAILKDKFPHIKFSVKSSNYSMGIRKTGVTCGRLEDFWEIRYTEQTIKKAA